MKNNDVLVYSKTGQRLANTSPRKAKMLLKNREAKIVGKEPFAIQLFHLTGTAGAFSENLNTVSQ